MNEGEDAGVELRSYLDAMTHGQEAPPRDRAARRERLLPALRTHVAREHRRVRRRRVWIRGAALAAVGGAAAVALLVTLQPGRGRPGGAGSQPAIALLDGTLLLGDGAQRRTLKPGETAAVGAEGGRGLETPAQEGARLQLASAATLMLAPSSRIGRLTTAASTAESGARIEAVTLMRGRAHLKVTKLQGAQRFHVLTPDADVEVRGTEFDVELRPGATPGTCVRVQEGLVAVGVGGAPHLVAPGETWGCAPTPAPSAATARPAEVQPVTETAETTPERRAEARARASDLRVQNQLFQSALVAERGGRLTEAAQLYRRLLSRAPHGPLAAQARSNLAVVSRPR
jgi:ferric-dicitrate binding protein FerR (iron transport regulator)